LPIVDTDRRFLGVVGLTIDSRFFAGILAAINSDDSASMTVIYNRAGDMLFRRSDTERFFGFNMIPTSTVYYPHLHAGLPTTRHVGPSAIDGKPRLFVVRDVGDTGVSLILSRQRSEVLATWRRNVVIYALIFVFTALVATSLAVVAARRKRELLRGKVFTDQLIATANVMVVGLDAGGRVSIFNETAERISGYGRHEVLGRAWVELAVPPQAACGVREMFDAFRHDGTLPHTAEYPLLTKGGEERIISWQNSVIKEPRAAISFGIDVTERNLMEAERERFVAMVSHEFRTPLATIDGAIQHLVMDDDGVDAATRRRYDKIQKATDRLTSLMDDYVLQERLGRSGQGLDLERVSTLSLLQDMQASSSALSAEHKVGIDEDDRPETVLCDAALMRLALRVLADNAVKYTPPGSAIRLGCRRAANHGVEFSVRDNGAGIPEDELPRLFDKFFRGRGGTQQPGSGIGLYLARSVVASHGGTLTAHNLPAGGVEFRVWLPDGAGGASDCGLP
jgi:PAS domain S-box-containing protein